MTDKEQPKAKREKEIFESFAKGSYLSVLADTVKTCEPPKPDICCSVNGTFLNWQR